MSQSRPQSSSSSPAATPFRGRDAEHPFRYTAALAGEIELRWQQRWDEAQTFRAVNPGEVGFDRSKKKFYCLDMFPYPSGAGLHVGHPEGYTGTDIISRYKRHRGYNVLHPMGWDAFGLPAEQYAIQTGVHPAVTIRKAADTFRGQLKRFGFSYDWSREVATSDPEFYRWTQWIWLKAYHAWFDPRKKAARPLKEMIRDLESGHLYVTPDGEVIHVGGLASDLAALTGGAVGSLKWNELSAEEQREVIDGQRLAYLAEQTVNWCPKLGTVLANEEVIDGRSERGGHPVRRRPLRQWMFRITAYAERLLQDLDLVDWPESTRTMQREWIGRSEGAAIDFEISNFKSEISDSDSIRVFTTRPDTVFGATYMVLAPEHPLVDAILANPLPETDAAGLRAYVEAARNKSDVDRQTESKEKTGVFTGAYAVNPATGERIPVWVADYVLMGYGHGAIMAVPGHDERDFEFARTFDLPIVRVVAPAGSDAGGSTPTDSNPWASDDTSIWSCAFEDEGIAVNSSNAEVSLDDLETPDAKRRIIEWLEKKNLGERKINFRLRDWLFSRQRYWGEPFPVVFDERGNHYAVDEKHLPVTLPDLEDFHPIESEDPQPLLAKVTEWVNTTAGAAGVSPEELPPETPVRRETNTMPGWAGSCWYYLRFCDPRNKARFISREAAAYWMGATSANAQGLQSLGVDLYIGGAEHAVLHLLYARFWHKMLFDLGEVSTPEPFAKLFHQGIITSFAFQREDKSLVPVDQVVPAPGDREGEFIETATGKPVTQIIAKMSKSLKNVQNPDTVIAEYGADTFRLYEMYMGPLDASKPWNPRDISGPFRFLQRAWRLVIDEQSGLMRIAPRHDDSIERALHRMIAKVGDDIERLAFNTAIAAMIEFVNAATSASAPRSGPATPSSPPPATGVLTRDQIERFAIALSPFVPHMAEELWTRLGHGESIAYEPWPEVDPALLVNEEIELPVQILGKVRGRIAVPAGADEETIKAAALADPKIAQQLEGRTVRKVIVVQGRIVNIVAN